MRRAGLSALLIICLSIFLCPEVAKPTVITVTETKTHDCCSKMSGCKMMPEQTSHHRPCGRESQPKSCCTVSCSTLILFCPISDRFLLRALVATLLQTTTQSRLHESSDRRLLRRAFDLSPSVRLGANNAHFCVCAQPRIHEISTGENHEISTLDCSNYDADRRDDDIVR